jgi:hypothetical protein
MPDPQANNDANNAMMRHVGKHFPSAKSGSNTNTPKGNISVTPAVSEVYKALGLPPKTFNLGSIHVVKFGSNPNLRLVEVTSKPGNNNEAATDRKAQSEFEKSRAVPESVKRQRGVLSDAMERHERDGFKACAIVNVKSNTVTSFKLVTPDKNCSGEVSNPEAKSNPDSNKASLKAFINPD